MEDYVRISYGFNLFREIANTQIIFEENYWQDLKGVIPKY